MERKRSKKGIKKLMCMLLAMALTVTLIPGGFARPDSVSADTADTRTKILEIEATSNLSTIFGYGKPVEEIAFTTIKGSPAYAYSASPQWQKKNAEGEWEDVTSGYFTEGTWRGRCYVNIDGQSAITHELAPTSTLRVDNKDWSDVESILIRETYSSAGYFSPEMTITNTGTEELVFNDSDDYDVPVGKIGSNITMINVSNAVTGGKSPYTFSKVAGPTWLNVSADGKITGTRPGTAQEATTATIQVKDSDDNTKTIKINVGAVVVRTKVSEIEATSNINDVFGYGKPVKEISFTTIKGSPAYAYSASPQWQKKNAEGEWEDVTSGYFTEGTWRGRCYVNIDGQSAITHELAPTSTLRVDNKDWSDVESILIRETYSSAGYFSPEMTIGEVKVSVENGTADSEKAVNGAKVTITANAAPSGKMFDKWVIVSGDVKLADASKTTTTFVMKYSPVKVKATYKDIPATKSVSLKLYGYDDISASWSKVTGVTGYKVEYYKSGSSKKYSKTVTGTSVKLANLTDGVKYYVKVIPYVTYAGKTTYGPAKSSSIYTLKKLNTPKVNKYSSSKVKVTWNNIAGESGYQISRSTKKTGTNVVSTYATTSGKYKVLKTTRNKTYYYKVRAYKTVDGKKIYGPWSSVKSYKLK